MVRNTLLILSVTVALAAMIIAVVKFANSQPTPSLAWVVIPTTIPLGAPFHGFVQFDSTSQLAEYETVLQLRICPMDGGPCLIAARKSVSSFISPTLVTATRSVPSGEYLVSLMVQTRNRFNILRTYSITHNVVKYGT